MKPLVRIAFFAVVALSITAGCADVKPWERGTLAKPEMALEPHPGLRAQRDHVYASREAATAGATAAGGGCGCN